VSKDALLPNFSQAEYKYLVPLIGLPLYEDIHTKYNTDPVGLTALSVEEKSLLAKLQAVVVSAAFLDELPRQTAKITDNGLRTARTSEMDRVYGWEYKEFKSGLTDIYYDSIEVLLNWLYDNKANFSLWTNNDAYKKFTGLLIKNGTEFNELYRLYQPMRSYWMLRNVLFDVQDNYHRIGLGDALLKYFLDLTSPAEKEKLILAALKKAMAFFTIYRACLQYAVRFSDAGFTIVNGGDNENADTAGRTTNGSFFDYYAKNSQIDGYSFFARAKRLCMEWRSDTACPQAFKDAYDAGPLEGYVDPKTYEPNADLISGFRLGI
jgi:hypothetical protein